jgi:hypothetical protein
MKDVTAGEAGITKSLLSAAEQFGAAADGDTAHLEELFAFVPAQGEDGMDELDREVAIFEGIASELRRLRGKVDVLRFDIAVHSEVNYPQPGSDVE